MARILLLVVLLVSVHAAHKHHPRFPKASEDYETVQFNKVACTSEHERSRNTIIQQSKCGAPKDVFEYLEPQGAHLQISPMAVWVKKCVGLCDHDTYGSKCIPLKKHTRLVPVRIFNVRTNKESCSTFAIEEHLICGCCAGRPEECARKCACPCPNKKEKRSCRSKRNQNMRWNRSKCVCEEKKKIRKN